jgi:hypothetical protein
MARIALLNIAKAPVARGYRANIMLTGENIQSLEDAETLVYVIHQRKAGFFCQPILISEHEYQTFNNAPANRRQGYATKADDWSTVTMVEWGNDF